MIVGGETAMISFDWKAEELIPATTKMKEILTSNNNIIKQMKKQRASLEFNHHYKWNPS